MEIERQTQIKKVLSPILNGLACKKVGLRKLIYLIYISIDTLILKRYFFN